MIIWWSNWKILSHLRSRLLAFTCLLRRTWQLTVKQCCKFSAVLMSQCCYTWSNDTRLKTTDFYKSTNPSWIHLIPAVATKLAEPWSWMHLRLSRFHSPPVTKRQWTCGLIHMAHCSITHWSIWGSIQLHWQHNWSWSLCCGKHFTQRASILINSLLLIMYLIDQFGSWVNWSIILIFFFCGVVSNEGQTASG